MKRTADGKWIAPRWWVAIFGGTFASRAGGFGWRPSFFRLVWRYYAEGWRECYSLSVWLSFRDNVWPNVLPNGTRKFTP